MVASGHDPETGKVFTAKKLRELLALKGIHSDFDLVGEMDSPMPFIMMRAGRGKKNVISAWQVLAVNHLTDPTGSQRDGFNKTFPIENGTRISALSRAQQWAEDHYGVGNVWVKTAFGSWAQSAHLDRRYRELLPETFDPDYRDPTVQGIIAKLYGDDTSERMFCVVVQLYSKPEPPLYVSATSEDNARRQVTQLFVRVAGTRVLDGLNIHVNEV